MERANGRKVDGRRIVVDYERGRTKSEWVPRRLGGGRGDKRRDRDIERMIRELKRTEPVLAERSRSRSPHSKRDEVKQEPKQSVDPKPAVVKVEEELKASEPADPHNSKVIF